MGILDRVIGGLNRIHDSATDLEYRLVRDRRYDQTERLLAEGVRNEGVLTGILQRYNDITETFLRVSWFGPEQRHAGILIGTGKLSILRLGMTVPISTDDGKAVLDWLRMTGVAVAQAPGQRPARTVPDEGIEDRAIDMRVLRRFKQWTPGRAVVQSFDRVSVMGMPTQNWNIQLRCADGSTRAVHRDEVPFYAHWFVRPGADVPVVLDPKDQARAQIEWRVLAEEHATAGGRWPEPPPPDSIAEQLLTAVPQPQPAMTTSAAPVDFNPSPDALAPIEGVELERWALVTASLSTARVKPAQYDAYATERFGVPAGRWTEIDRQWTARQHQDWRVGAKMGEAVGAARKRLK